MPPTYHPELEQGTERWLEARRGLLTASEMKLVLTPTLKIAENEAVRTHIYELMAQRITGYVEPQYVGDHMVRGKLEELDARLAYAETYAPVEEIGFITNTFQANDYLTYTVGYSPDGLVGDDGLIECKSRLQKYQVRTIVEEFAGGTIPAEFMLQVQTGLLVSERKWIDFISYSGGLPMTRTRVYPDEKVQGAILEASALFEIRLAEKMEVYWRLEEAGIDLTPTERRIEQEMYV